MDLNLWFLRELEGITGFFFCKEIENIFLGLRQCTLNSRLREFQFKLIYNILYTKHHLFRFGLVSTNLCSFCEKEEETYKHLFYN